jgi:hypothetical protein
MSDDKPTAQATAADDAATKVVDEAADAAESTRTTAKWIATALAAIPALGAVGALVRAPGDEGFDKEPLFLGILFAAAAAILGILAVARVLEPVLMSDRSLSNSAFDITKVPGHPYRSYTELLTSLRQLRATVRTDEADVATVKVAVANADAVAARADMDVAAAELSLADAPGDTARQRALADAKVRRDSAKASARVVAAVAAGRAEEHRLLDGQLLARESVRSRALRLATAEKVGERYRYALVAVGVAVALAAAGVFFLAIAPVPKDGDDDAAVSLVTISLNDAGKAVLGCSATTLQGLRIGGTDEVPQLVTLPTTECPSRFVEFKVAEPSSLGSVAEEKPIPVASPTQ